MLPVVQYVVRWSGRLIVHINDMNNRPIDKDTYLEFYDLLIKILKTDSCSEQHSHTIHTHTTSVSQQHVPLIPLLEKIRTLPCWHTKHVWCYFHIFDNDSNTDTRPANPSSSSRPSIICFYSVCTCLSCLLQNVKRCWIINAWTFDYFHGCSL